MTASHGIVLIASLSLELLYSGLFTRAVSNI